MPGIIKGSARAPIIYRLVRQEEGEGALGRGHPWRKFRILCFFELAELGRYFLCLVGILFILGVGVWDIRKLLEPSRIEVVPVQAVSPDEVALIMMRQAMQSVKVAYPEAWPEGTRQAGLDILKVEAVISMGHRFRSSLDSQGVLNARPSESEVLRQIARDGYIDGNCVVAAKAAGSLLTALGYSCKVVYTRRHAFVRVFLPNWYVDVLNVEPKSGVLLPPYPRPLEYVIQANQQILEAEAAIPTKQSRQDVERADTSFVVFSLRDYASSLRWVGAGMWFLILLMPYRVSKEVAVGMGLFWFGLLSLLLEFWVFGFTLVRFGFVLCLLVGAALLGVQGRDFRKPLIYKGSGEMPRPVWHPTLLYDFVRK